MKNSCPMNAQRGLTLIELMIAMLLGVFLIGGVIQVFVSTKETYRMQEGLSRLQENGRFAMDFVERDLRMANYKVCLSSPLLPVLVPEPEPVPYPYPVQWTIINGTNDTGLNNSDMIAVQMNLNACLPAPPAPTTIHYYISTGANGRPSLYQTVLTPAVTSELIEDVENMQIVYGEDTDMDPLTGISLDGAPNYYAPANSVVDMRRVVSIRISLLLSSSDNLAAQPVPYNYNGATITPADRRIRRVFASTIALRNRLR